MIDKIEIGKKYRVITSACSGYNNLLNPAYVMFTNESSYDIFNRLGIKIADCWQCLKKKDLEPYIVDIEHCEQGDVLVSGSAHRKVLGRCGDMVFLARSSDPDVADDTLWHWKELVKDGWKVQQEEPKEPAETVEINGKKYLREEFDEMIAELKPIE